MYTVHEVAKLAHTTVKTLHHYHKIGLLIPEEITEAGYRLYGKKGVERLQQILFYKELDFPFKEIKRLLNEVKQILSIGFSGFIGQISLSLVSLVFNRLSYEYGGNTGLAAYTIAMLVYIPILGLGQGIQPIIGYSYGHAAIDRVKKTLKYAIKYVLIFCIFMFLLIEIFSSYLVSAFGGSTDLQLLDTATFGMRIFCCMVPIVGVQMIGVNFFQYIGDARKAIFLSSLRQLILMIPLVYILPKFLGLLGVWLATPISDFISFTVVAFYLWIQYRKFKPEVSLKINNQSL